MRWSLPSQSAGGKGVKAKRLEAPRQHWSTKMGHSILSELSGGPPHWLDISHALSSFPFLIAQAPDPSLHLLCSLPVGDPHHWAWMPSTACWWSSCPAVFPAAAGRKLSSSRSTSFLSARCLQWWPTDFRMCHKPLSPGFHIIALYDLALIYGLLLWP